jgi:predicted permease
MRGFWRDLRYAARTLGRSPGLVLVATLSLGLGMGVNTSLFGAVKAVLFTGATGAARERLVRAWIGDGRSISYANLEDVRSAGVFAAVAGYQMMVLSARPQAEAEKAVGEIVTANYFDVLGVRAAIGRTFSSPEADPNRDPGVAVLSDQYWRRHFDSDPAAIGRTIIVNGQACTVVGVLPENFHSIEGFGIAPEMYVPLSRAIAANYEDRDGFRLRVLARLKDGRTRQQTEAALAAAAAQLERAYPKENHGFARSSVRLFGVSAVEQLREAGGVAPAMAIVGLFVLIAGTVLLIACGNVAALLLARGASRRREIAVRLALGGSRRRIVQQLLAESLVLALLGAGCGWLLNLWTVPLLAHFDVPLPVPLPFDFRLDEGLGILPLEIVMAGAAMLLCGLAPAMESTRLALAPALKETPAQFGNRRSRRRNLRVVWQVAGAMMQLVVAAVFLRTLAGVVYVDPGFDADRVLAVDVTLDRSRFGAERELNYVEDAVRRVAALPGVDAASAACLAPLSGWLNEAEVNVEGRAADRVPASKVNCVSPAYFRTMGIALMRGREFDMSDRPGAPAVAIVGETLARRLFPDGQALGRRVRVDRGRVVEIVGVVRDSKYGSLAEPPQPLLYWPMAQDSDRPGTVLHVRTSRPRDALAMAIRGELAKMEKDVPVTVRPMRAYVDLSVAPVRVAAHALAIMGGLGVLLALVGLYGLISHNVSRRTAEFGIRLALGASPTLLRRGVLKSGLVLVGSGVALGLVLAVMVTRALTHVVAGVQIGNPLVLLAPGLLLLAAGLAASYVPARRATRVDPVTALRCE